MKNLPKLQVNNIKQKLPNLKELVERDTTDYQMIFVSIFDHWLTAEEFQSEVHTEDPIELSSRKQKLLDFIIGLHKLTPTFSWRYKRHNRFFIYPINTMNQLLNQCDINNQNGESGQRYDIILPEFKAVYSEEWDWTNIIWYREKDRIQPLINLAENQGLYILENS